MPDEALNYGSRGDFRLLDGGGYGRGSSGTSGRPIMRRVGGSLDGGHFSSRPVRAIDNRRRASPFEFAPRLGNLHEEFDPRGGQHNARRMCSARKGMIGKD